MGLHCRVITYSIRANEAHRPASHSESHTLTRYYQTTLLIGYISLLATAALAFQCLFIDSIPVTKPVQVERGTGTSSPSLVLKTEQDSSLTPPLPKTADQSSPSLSQTETQPRLRWWGRRICSVAVVGSFLPMVIGIAAGPIFVVGESSTNQAKVARGLR